MKIVIAFIILITMMSSSVSAKIWKVGYGINKGDFTTIQEAHDAAASGDTIYVAGGVYTELTITKKLTLFGTGYFLNENPNTQANPLVSRINGYINIESASEGSCVTGFEIGGGIGIYGNNVIIMRNHIFANGIKILGNNCLIRQNYIQSSCLLVQGDNIHVVARNNFFYAYNSVYNLTIESGGSNTIELINNILLGPINIDNAIFRNNIFTDGRFPSNRGNNLFFNNVFSESFIMFIENSDWTSQWTDSSNGNISNISASSLFVGTGSDGSWQLKPGSPAIGAGVGGVDCGIFGGDDPYVLSGIPAIPTITSFSAPFSGNSTTGLPVHITGRAGR